VPLPYQLAWGRAQVLDAAALFSAVDLALARRVLANVARAAPGVLDDVAAAMAPAVDAMHASARSLLELSAEAAGGGAAQARSTPTHPPVPPVRTGHVSSLLPY